MLGKAATARAEDAERVRLIDHQPGAVALLQLDELRQVGDVAVHGIEAFDDDQRVAARAPVRAQQPLEVIEIVVPEGERLGVRKLDAGEQAVVRQLVVQDEVARNRAAC